MRKLWKNLGKQINKYIWFYSKHLQNRLNFHYMTTLKCRGSEIQLPLRPQGAVQDQ